MLQEITLTVPKRLQTDGKGRLNFTVEIEGNVLADRRYRRTGRIDGVTTSDGCRPAAEFDDLGCVALSFPGDISNEIRIVVEFADRHTGDRLTGGLKIPVEHVTGTNIVVDARSGNANGYGLISKNVRVHGGELRTFKVESRSVVVPLVHRLSESAVPLRALTQNGVILDVSRPGSDVLRVLQVCAAPRLVIGRCRASQLRKWARDKGDEVAAAALKRLRSAGSNRIGWTLAWDNRRVPRLVAALEPIRRDDEYAFGVTSLTDYSPKPARLFLSTGDPPVELEPGRTAEIVLVSESQSEFTVGQGFAAEEVVRFVADAAVVGDVQLPAVRTRQTTFRWTDPDSGASWDVQYLGVWIPRTLQQLGVLLRAAHEHLPITFTDEDDTFSLWLSWDERADDVMVSSNYDLRSALERGRG